CYRKYRVKRELSGRVRVLVIGLINRRVKEKQSRGYVNPIFGSDSGLSYRAYKPAVKRAKKSRGDGNRPRPGLKPHALRGAAARPTGGLSWQRLGAGQIPRMAMLFAYWDGILGACIWFDRHDSWHQEGKIQPNSNAGHVWGS
ncbi:hypothetical protein BHM03_00054855, partial [Ensete ventricosum]